MYEFIYLSDGNGIKYSMSFENVILYNIKELLYYIK